MKKSNKSLPSRDRKTSQCPPSTSRKHSIGDLKRKNYSHIGLGGADIPIHDLKLDKMPRCIVRKKK